MLEKKELDNSDEERLERLKTNRVEASEQKADHPTRTVSLLYKVLHSITADMPDNDEWNTMLIMGRAVSYAVACITSDTFRFVHALLNGSVCLYECLCLSVCRSGLLRMDAAVLFRSVRKPSTIGNIPRDSID